ncbi:MAG: SDR family NAD(P)-dependent oxidoreductase [Deltaproteobacteria bacterium]|nr:MAG: SDR family NAD(P)-dependent oxidoreductase [Deltaproteobacteria bacterium]
MGVWNNRVAAVTGAASGIGRELAMVLHEQGCKLALSDVNEEGLAETRRLVEEAGGTAHTQRVDVSQRAEVEAWAEAVAEHYGGVDIIINNAGVTVVDTVEHISYEDFEWLMGINFWGVVYGTKTFLPYLRRSDEAYIVNISSIFGIISVPSQSSYNASKFAVRGFTESLRQELHDSHITVSCVHPGGIKTSITRNARHYHRPGRTFEREKLVNNFENKMARTTARRAAEIIVNGMQKKKRRILVGGDARLMDRIQRWFPVGYERLTRRRPKK